MVLKLTSLRIEGLRTLRDVTVPLDGLTVLIGENGTGKSSILEALEILRRAMGSNFLPDLAQIHGGMELLRRDGSPFVRISATALDNEASSGGFTYFLSFDDEKIIEENLQVDLGKPEPLKLIQRFQSKVMIYDVSQKLIDISKQVASRDVVLANVGWSSPHRAFKQMKDALASVDVQMPFEVRARWVSEVTGRKSPMRNDVMISRPDRLERLGANLANVFSHLHSDRSTSHWQRTMDLVRVGLGQDIESVHARAGNGGHVGLWLRYFSRDKQTPAAALSDGQLAYLAFVGLCRLQAPASVLAFDEPELHLHPRLVQAVADMFSEYAETTPTLLATHSRRLLDALPDRGRKVLLCKVEQTDANNASETVLYRADGEALEKWLETYEGLGTLLDEGYGEIIMTEPVGGAPG